MLNRNYLLSICIPTYNRPEKIEKMIVGLSKIKKIETVEILIFDNCSEIPVSDIYDKVGIKLTNLNIIRNPINVGANINIMRCIEFAKTTWVWLLGDDDDILENSIEIIMEDISKSIIQNNTAIIKYSSELGLVCNPIIIDDFNKFFDFITKNSYYSNLLFMSSSIINRDIYCKYYAKAIENGASFCHIYPLFPLLYSKEANVYLSDRNICTWGRPEWHDSWFYGVVYQDMLRQFSSFYFLDSKKIRIMGRKWLTLGKVGVLLGGLIVISIKCKEKKFIRKSLKNYYYYLYSGIEKILLLPIYIFLWLLLPHGKFVARLVMYHPKYAKIRDINVNI